MLAGFEPKLVRHNIEAVLWRRRHAPHKLESPGGLLIRATERGCWLGGKRLAIDWTGADEADPSGELSPAPTPDPAREPESEDGRKAWQEVCRRVMLEAEAEDRPYVRSMFGAYRGRVDGIDLLELTDSARALLRKYARVIRGALRQLEAEGRGLSIADETDDAAR